MKPGWKNPLLRTCNLVLYAGFCLLAGTGVLLHLRLLPGSQAQGGRGLELLGWSRHEWGEVHTWTAYVVLAALVAHLLLNWKWLEVIAASRRRWMLWIPLGLGLAVIAFFLLWPLGGEVLSGSGGQGYRGGRP